MGDRIMFSLSYDNPQSQKGIRLQTEFGCGASNAYFNLAFDAARDVEPVFLCVIKEGHHATKETISETLQAINIASSKNNLEKKQWVTPVVGQWLASQLLTKAGPMTRPPTS